LRRLVAGLFAIVGGTEVAAASAGFVVHVRDEPIRHEVFAVTAQPEEPVDIAVAGQGAGGDFRLASRSGRVVAGGDASWTWIAPASVGRRVLRVERQDAPGAIKLNVFVTLARASMDRRGRVNGYRVGHYPDRVFRGLAAYQAPQGLIEVTPANKDIRVSPHFRLGEFVSKQQGAYPRYVVLRPRLLRFLEAILAEARRVGVQAEGLTIMSGYRTPYYNARIGQGRFSRHKWGDAADIYIDDRPPWGRMDDITGDGRSDYRDAVKLARIASRVRRLREPDDFTGGLGVYGPRSHRGPFVHVDIRGYKARWRHP
jgi:hypothetical protein